MLIESHPQTHTYSVPEEVRDSCEPVLLEVVAISDLGWSNAAQSRTDLLRCKFYNFYIIFDFLN